MTCTIHAVELVYSYKDLYIYTITHCLIYILTRMYIFYILYLLNIIYILYYHILYYA